MISQTIFNKVKSIVLHKKNNIIFLILFFLGFFCIGQNSKTKVTIIDETGKIPMDVVIKFYDKSGNEIVLNSLETIIKSQSDSISLSKNNDIQNNKALQDALKSDGWDTEERLFSDSLNMSFNIPDWNRKDLKRFEKKMKENFNPLNTPNDFESLFGDMFGNLGFFGFGSSAFSSIEHNFTNPLVVINNRYFDKSELTKLKMDEIKEVKLLSKKEAEKKYGEKMKDRDGAIVLELK